jgi:hypothetical protein
MTDRPLISTQLIIYVLRWYVFESHACVEYVVVTRDYRGKSIHTVAVIYVMSLA